MCGSPTLPPTRACFILSIPSAHAVTYQQKELTNVRDLNVHYATYRDLHVITKLHVHTVFVLVQRRHCSWLRVKVILLARTDHRTTCWSCQFNNYASNELWHLPLIITNSSFFFYRLFQIFIQTYSLHYLVLSCLYFSSFFLNAFFPLRPWIHQMTWLNQENQFLPRFFHNIHKIGLVSTLK